MTDRTLQTASQNSKPIPNARQHSPGPLPSPTPPAQRGAVYRLDRIVLRRLLSAIGNPPVTVTLWNGEQMAALDSSASPIAHVFIQDRRTLWKICFDPWFEFGDAYAAGRLEVEGDFGELLTIASRSLNVPQNASLASRFVHWLHKPRPNTLASSRDNIHCHYDLGNDFYQLWLDEQMVYTCAYFPQRTLSLEESQVAKMEHVCRKLDLKPGETVVEAGCGWGSLALHMAQRYEVTVKAFNISAEQVRYARERARQEGLDDRVEFIEDDWRNIQEHCDAFVSVGMLEHVGRSNYRRLGDVIHRCLAPMGRGLIHTIGRNCPRPFNPWIERHIFPGAYPPTLREMTEIFEPHQFSVLDVENLRLHYAQTLRHWLDRFNRSVDTVREMFDEKFVRMWRLYLTGSIAGFESGVNQLFQVVFARHDNNHVPWTRSHLYLDHEESGRRDLSLFRQQPRDASREIA